MASIVVAALTDAREGARNNRRNEMARQYVTALELYFSENGTFPDGGCTDSDVCDPVTYVCLGDGYPAGTCYIWGAHSENSTVNTQLSEYAPAMPPLLDEAVSGATTFLGAAYGCLDETTCKGYRLSWVLEGEGSDADCFGGATENDLGPVSLCTFTGGSLGN